MKTVIGFDPHPVVICLGKNFHLPFSGVLKTQISGSEESPERLINAGCRKNSMTVFVPLCGLIDFLGRTFDRRRRKAGKVVD